MAKRDFHFEDEESGRRFSSTENGLWSFEGSTYLDWDYPEIYKKDQRGYLVLGLCHTRAADEIRIEYDSERDGWIIFALAGYDNENGDRKWREAAFIDGNQQIPDGTIQ